MSAGHDKGRQPTCDINKILCGGQRRHLRDMHRQILMRQSTTNVASLRILIVGRCHFPKTQRTCLILPSISRCRCARATIDACIPYVCHRCLTEARLSLLMLSNAEVSCKIRTFHACVWNPWLKICAIGRLRLQDCTCHVKGVQALTDVSCRWPTFCH
uniref:Uncharacterized protein n=1 Tax=Solanum lycopersicum TaxID=4081 RepID=A0A3Q7GGT5_SOLLC